MRDKLKNAAVVFLCAAVIFGSVREVLRAVRGEESGAAEVVESMEVMAAQEVVADFGSEGEMTGNEVGVMECGDGVTGSEDGVTDVEVGMTERSDTMTMLREVILGEREFYMDVYGAVFREKMDEVFDEIYGDEQSRWEAGAFAVVDMDGDGVFEVVLENKDNSDRLVLFCGRYETVVYSYACVFRGMLHLKVDGTFSGSGGAAYNTLSRLFFGSGSVYEYVLAESDTQRDASGENDELMPIYYVDGRVATAEEHAAAWAEFEAQEDAVWYEFTAENIEKYVR